MSDFDELLDEVLKEEAQAEPQFGLERRILSRVREQSTQKRWPKIWWVPAGALGCLALGLTLTTQHGRDRGVGSRAVELEATSSRPRAGKEERTAEVKNVPVRRDTKPERAQRLTLRNGAAHRETVAKIEERPLPKMETFPAVTQQGEAPAAALLAASPETAQAMQELKAEQERPLQMDAIEIKPL